MFRYISLLLINLFLSNIALASIHDDCIFAWENGEVDRKVVSIRPIGKECYNNCQRICTQKFSRQYNDIELNQDKIYGCIKNCRMGQSRNDIIYSSKIRVPNDAQGTNQKYEEIAVDHNNKSEFLPVIWSKDEVVLRKPNNKYICSTDIHDITSAKHNYYDSSMYIDGNKQTVIISNQGGEMYFGKHKAIYMFPYNYSHNGTNICNLDSFNNIEVGNHEDIPRPPTECGSINIDGEFERECIDFNNINGLKKWKVTNKDWVNTGICISKNDYLNIKYGGDIIDGNKHFYASGLKLSIQPGGKVTKEAAAKLEREAITLGNDIGKGKCTKEDHEYKVTEHSGWDGVSWCSEVGKNSCFNNTHGVQGRLYRSANYKKRWTGEQGFVTFKHKVNDESQRSKALGGYFVVSDVKKRSANNLFGLQVAIVPDSNAGFRHRLSEYKPSILSYRDWHNICTNKHLDGGKCQINTNVIEVVKEDASKNLLVLKLHPSFLEGKKGRVFFRVNNNLSKDHDFWDYSSGEYRVLVERKVKTDNKFNFIDKLITQIKEYLLGSGSKSYNKASLHENGLIPMVFQELISGDFANTIRVLLFLYIVYTGFCFATGMAQLNQQEAVVRIIKITIVLVLISPSAWEMFYTLFFSFFIEGGSDLMRIMTSFSDDVVGGSTESIFQKFEKPFIIMFSKVTWIKFSAIIGRSLSGILFFLLILLAVILYAVCLMRVTLIYLISVVMIGFLIMLGPIFISLMLFKYTNQMFMSWWKNLLGFVLQPIFIFVPVLILNELLVLSLESVLNFSACKGCWWYMNFGIFGFCAIPGYVAAPSMYLPASSVIANPVSFITGIIYFALIAHCYYKICDMAADISNAFINR